MITRQNIYTRLETAWVTATVSLCAAAALFVLAHFAFSEMEDLALQLAVFNDAWKQEVASHCVQHIPGCAALSFNRKGATMEHPRPVWQWFAFRLDVSIDAKPAARALVEQRLMEHVSPLHADHIALHFTDLKDKK